MLTSIRKIIARIHRRKPIEYGRLYTDGCVFPVIFHEPESIGL
jgi:hypothetical protein